MENFFKIDTSPNQDNLPENIEPTDEQEIRTENEEEKENLTRRDFLKNAMKIGGAILASNFIPEEVSGQWLKDAENLEWNGKISEYKIIFSENVSEKEKDRIIRGQDKIKQEIEKGVPEIVVRLKKRGLKDIPEISLEHTILKVEEKRTLFKNTPENQKLIEQGKLALHDALKFWDHSQIKKPAEIIFKIPQKEEDIQEAILPPYEDDKKITIKIVGSISREIDSFVRLKNIQGLDPKFNARLIFQQYGTADRTYIVNNSKKPIKSERREILWSVDSNDNISSMKSIIALPSEALHTQLSKFTDERIEKKVLNSNISSIQEVDRIIPPFTALEEAIVHAIQRIWAEKYFRANKIKTNAEIFPGYEGEKEIFDFAKKNNKNAQELIDLYINNPEELKKISKLY